MPSEEVFLATLRIHLATRRHYRNICEVGHELLVECAEEPDVRDNCKRNDVCIIRGKRTGCVQSFDLRLKALGGNPSGSALLVKADYHSSDFVASLIVGGEFATIDEPNAPLSLK